MERKILISVDESEHSQIAFDWYMKMIRQTGDHVILCHIPENPDLPSISVSGGLNIPYEMWYKAMNEQFEKAKSLQVKFENELIKHKVTYSVRFEHKKNTGDGIVSIAEEEKSDFIVMGTRGLDPLRRTLLGSVSDYVIRHSKIPVFVCPS